MKKILKKVTQIEYFLKYLVIRNWNYEKKSSKNEQISKDKIQLQSFIENMNILYNIK